jgi:hypothetical protein
MVPPHDTERMQTSMTAMDGPRLHKMDVSPPTFDGVIDGIKLNSFLFQFESYFQQKGYRLDRDDHLLPRELNQCVRKNALVWYERYMTDDMTSKLWSVMKSEMIQEFREPNFQAKVRNQLLQLKQIGAYHGYVNKFRELQRVVGLDELTAINVFVNGLTNAQMKIAIQRKQPTTLTAAVQEGFLEWELQEKPATSRQRVDDDGGFAKKQTSGKQKRSNAKADHRRNNSGEPSRRTTAAPGTLCSHCGRGVHKLEDCWVLHPEKKPRQVQRKQQLHNRIFALLESLDLGDEHNRASNGDGQSN